MQTDVTTQAVRDGLAPDEVLARLLAGNERFAGGQPTARDLPGQVAATAPGQFPMAVVLGCMDSRVPVELVFDVGIGDVFAIRVAGNVATEEALGSIEYGCAVAGAKLVLVLGHSRCGAVAATIDHVAAGAAAEVPAGCDNLPSIVRAIAPAVEAEQATTDDRRAANAGFAANVTRLNVQRTLSDVAAKSPALRGMIDDGRVRLVGATYDVETGRVTLLGDDD